MAIRQRFVITLLCVFFGCAACAQQSDAFFSELLSRKGKSYSGKAIYMPDTIKPNDFWGKTLQFTVTEKNGEIKMPFTVGENTSRTWIIRKTSRGLELKHDHRHPDGQPDSITNYGGQSDKILGTQLSQFFNADEYTAKLIPAAAGNRWIMQFSHDKKKFYYILERDNILRFKAEFDL